MYKDILDTKAKETNSNISKNFNHWLSTYCNSWQKFKLLILWKTESTIV